MILLGEKMEYGTLGITLKTGLTIPNDLAINTVKRIDIAPKNQNHLKKTLKTFGKKFDITAVQCFSKKIFRQAVKDSRIDIITLPNQTRNEPIFGRNEANSAKDNMISFELNLVDLFNSDLHKRLIILDKIKKDVWNAQKYGIPIISSSGANDPIYMREPRALVALLATLGIQEENAIEMVTRNPSEVIMKNKKVRSSGF
jgi:RNase P/RNase MRP subunit p30